MKEDLEVHPVRKADLRRPDCYAAWQDPDRLAPMTPQKVQAVLTNPLSRDEADPAQLIGTMGGVVIGRIDLLPGEMIVRRQPVPVLWGSSLFVPPQHRHTGLGLLLMFRMQALHHTIAVCGISQIIYPIYQKLRWVDFEMPRYILLRRSRSFVERYAGEGVHSKWLSILVDAGLAAHRSAQAAFKRLGRSSSVVQRIDCAPPEFDEHFDRTPALASCHRSSAWLNWLLAHRTSDDHRSKQSLYGLYDRNDPKMLLGYFLVKVRFHATATQRQFKNLFLGSVSDWLIFEPQKLGFAELIDHATRVLHRSGVDAIEVCIAQAELAPTLRRKGFLRAGSLRMLFKPNPKSPLYSRQLHAQSDWRIRPVEGDHFFT